jgi:adenine C2-methylase RlmN of 23S rRNA A2503 and tRNA A37
VRLKILSSKKFENTTSGNFVVKVNISMNLEYTLHIAQEQRKTACLACYINFNSSSSFCDVGKTKIFRTDKEVKLSLYLDWIDLALVNTVMNL